MAGFPKSKSKARPGTSSRTGSCNGHHYFIRKDGVYKCVNPGCRTTR